MAESKAYERLQRKITIENLWLYIIKVLKDSSELRAYDIKKELSHRFNVKPATITVYAVIYKMVKEGLIEPVKNSEGLRYRVTEKGIKTFEQGIKYINEIIGMLST
ncbi:MAG: PadR family transcriptional regulator [Sulfolobales archaeon]|nr:PadR family transcriptional regulator [Sulfolobales archaeon]MCX8185937.1 PadR family transcriptional regulator [Sulfolobales archaeon]MDW7969194.1 PadR family transcriptional regulator [Sulfolobales archaeon]